MSDDMTRMRSIVELIRADDSQEIQSAAMRLIGEIAAQAIDRQDCWGAYVMKITPRLTDTPQETKAKQMIAVKEDCFAIRTTKAGKQQCTVLKAICCDGCAFYKPTEVPQIYVDMIRDKLAGVRKEAQKC
jgi:hypothetical protein